VIGITESAVEEAVLEWFEGLHYTIAHGPDIAVDAFKLERSSYADVVLVERLRTALTNINPVIPPDAIEEAISKSLRLRYSWRPGTSQRLTRPADPLHAACAKGHDKSTWSSESTELNGRN
jgi:type I site-specific restriction-modification system R (restriction) subunit